MDIFFVNQAETIDKLSSNEKKNHYFFVLEMGDKTKTAERGIAVVGS